MKIKTKAISIAFWLINLYLLPKDNAKKFNDYIVATKRTKSGFLYTMRIVYNKRRVCYINLSQIIVLSNFKLRHVGSIEITNQECLQLFSLFDDLESINEHEIIINK